MFGIGGTEIFLVVLVAFLFFGPDKLPQLARTVGRFLREFKRIQDTMEATIRLEMDRAEDDDTATDKPAATASAPAGGWSADDEDEEDEE